MKQIRVLLVDDEPQWSSLIRKVYEEVFPEFALSPVITIMDNARVAKDHVLGDLAKKDKGLPVIGILGDDGDPYDIASVDLQLEDSEVDGLGILEALKLNQTAWTAVLLTGFEMNAEKATKSEGLLHEFRSKAQQNFWPRRLLTIAKPHPGLPPEEQTRLLRTGIGQVAKFFKDLEPRRHMFKKVEVQGKKKISKKNRNCAPVMIDSAKRIVFQVQCGFGDMVELDENDFNGIKTMHELFKKGPGGHVTPEEGGRIEPYTARPKKTRNALTTAAVSEDPIREFFVKNHPQWDSYDSSKREALIEEALPEWYDSYRELRNYENVGRSLSSSDQSSLAGMNKTGLIPLVELRYQYECGEHNGKLGNNPSGEVTFSRAAQEGVSPVRQRTSESEDALRMAGMKSKLCAKLREKNVISFADYIDNHVVGIDRNWTHKQPEGVTWLT